MAEEEEKGADLLNDAGKLLRRKFEKKYRVLLDEKWLKSCLDFIAAGQEGGGASTDGSAHVEGQVLVQVLHSNLADSTATKSHSSAADSAVPRPLTPCLLQIEEIMEIGSSALSLLHLIQDSRQKRAISKQGSSSILLGSSFSEEKVSSEIVNFPRKMLALVLSNGAGQLRFSAIERKLCPQLSITMPLGTKVLLRQLSPKQQPVRSPAPLFDHHHSTRESILMLEPHMIQVVGGYVPEWNQLDPIARIEAKLCEILGLPPPNTNNKANPRTSSSSNTTTIRNSNFNQFGGSSTSNNNHRPQQQPLIHPPLPTPSSRPDSAVVPTVASAGSAFNLASRPPQPPPLQQQQQQQQLQQHNINPSSADIYDFSDEDIPEDVLRQLDAVDQVTSTKPADAVLIDEYDIVGMDINDNNPGNNNNDDEFYDVAMDQLEDTMFHDYEEHEETFDDADGFMAGGRDWAEASLDDMDGAAGVNNNINHKINNHRDSNNYDNQENVKIDENRGCVVLADDSQSMQLEGEPEPKRQWLDHHGVSSPVISVTAGPAVVVQDEDHVLHISDTDDDRTTEMDNNLQEQGQQQKQQQQQQQQNALIQQEPDISPPSSSSSPRRQQNTTAKTHTSYPSSSTSTSSSSPAFPSHKNPLAQIQHDHHTSPPSTSLPIPLDQLDDWYNNNNNYATTSSAGAIISVQKCRLETYEALRLDQVLGFVMPVILTPITYDDNNNEIDSDPLITRPAFLSNNIISSLFMSPAVFLEMKLTSEGRAALRDASVIMEDKLLAGHVGGDVLVRLPPRDGNGHSHVPWDDLKHALEIIDINIGGL